MFEIILNTDSNLQQKVSSEDIANLLKSHGYNTEGMDEHSRLLLFKRNYRHIFPSSENFYRDLQMASNTLIISLYSHTTKDNDFLHSHNFYEMIYCTKGVMRYVISGNIFQVVPGDIVFIPSGISHQPFFLEDPEGCFERYIVHISNSFIDSISEQCEDLKLFFSKLSENCQYVIRLTNTPFEKYLDFFPAMLQEYNKRSMLWEFYMGTQFAQLCCHLMRSLNTNSESAIHSSKDELIDKILKYVVKNLHEKITVQSVAREFLISPSTISHLFKEQMQTSFYKLVIQYRLNESKNLIMQDYPLNQISDAIGFQDYTTFYRAFKKEFGISPREYRDLLSQNSSIVPHLD